MCASHYHNVENFEPIKGTLPSNRVSFLSRMFFWWTIGIIKLGGQRDLEQEDIPSTMPEDTVAHLKSQFQKYWNDEKALLRPSLVRALLRVFGTKLVMFTGVLIIQQCIIRLAVPVLLGILIQHIGDIIVTDTVSPDIYLASTFLVVFAFTGTILFQRSNFGLQYMGMRIRVTLTSIIYSKTLRLGLGDVASTGGIGKLTNIISNDVSRFDRSMQDLPYTIVVPLQTIIVTLVLWQYTGVACLAGMLIQASCVPLQALFGRIMGTLRARIAVRSDGRIRLVNELVNGIALIKLCTLENLYKELVSEARKLEIESIRKKASIEAMNYNLYIITCKISVLATFVTVVLTNHPLTPESVFVTLSVYNVMSVSSAIWFPQGVSGLAQILVSTRRIQALLLLQEVEPAASSRTGSTFHYSGVKIDRISAAWSSPGGPFVLKDISIEVRSRELVGIIGPVGCGKSSLLQLILGELLPLDGTVITNGRIAYASQDPWLFSGNLRENILCGEPFDLTWYQTVIEACGLAQDLVTLSHGDLTLIGDRGINLSGGQKSRVNLARAIYSRADVYLLDDPLSAVDARVAKQIMEKCVQGILRDQCVLLVTHQTHYLKSASLVLAMETGRVVKSGSYIDVCGEVEAKSGPTTIDDIILEDDADGLGNNGPLTTSGNYGTFQAPAVTREQRVSGDIGWKLYYNYITCGITKLNVLIMIVLNLVLQVAQNGSDVWLKIWTDYENSLSASGGKYNDTPNNIFTNCYNTTTAVLRANPFCDSGSEADEEDTPHHFEYLYIYVGLVMGIFLLALWRGLNMFLGFVSCSQVMHEQMVGSILGAPMEFFELNSAGTIMNRFSADIGNMDEMLPLRAFLITETYLQILGSMFVIVLTCPEMSLPSIIFLCLAWYIRTKYVRTSAKIQRLEATSRSPIFAHFATTLSGLPVIRAMKLDELFLSQFHRSQDIHSSNYFMYLSAMRWAMFSVELVADAYLMVVLVLFLLVSNGPSALGLVISSALLLVFMVASAMIQSAEVINQIIAVERVTQYATIEPEARLKSRRKVTVAKSWPANCEIRWDDISVAYQKSGNRVLKDVSFRIKAGEKIGIVGRTGAGKSSLISTLFRMVEPCAGKQHIGNVDICQLDLHDLRRRMSIIPQNPVLFTGSLRRNLDPFCQHGDNELWNTLNIVQLGSKIRSSLEGLSLKVSEGGGNFSHGERQLICLARTILQNNAILFMDEATANIDRQTDSIIQEIIRDRFRSITMLTISHRLDSVMKSDRILVLEAGQIKEFDEPIKLLDDPSTLLSKFVEQTGQINSTRLRKMAMEDK